MKTIKEKLQLRLLCSISMNLNMFSICAECEVKKLQQAAFIKKTILILV